MGVALVIGCGLIALGPSAMLLLFVVGRRPALVIIAIVSAFFWLASFALASLLWSVYSTNQSIWLLTICVGVAFQGSGRLILARVYLRTERAINHVQAQAQRESVRARVRGINSGDESDHDGERSALLKLNGLSSSIAAGVGWGAMHAVVVAGTALAKHTGAGAAYSPSCPRVPSVIVSAFSAQAFVWLDLLLMAIAFAGHRSNSQRLFTADVAIHLVAALTTGFNFVDDGCAVSLPLLYGVVVLAFFATRRFGLLSATADSQTRDR